MNLRLPVLASAAVATVLMAVSARAEPPAPKDLKTVQACLQTKGDRPANREACIGAVANPCIGKEEERASYDVIACFDREQRVWDVLLNNAFAKLRGSLDDDQKTKLRDMQRSWLESRERTCAFYYHYFQGTMANPMIANCNNRETARRALFLLGFAEDIADRKEQ